MLFQSIGFLCFLALLIGSLAVVRRHRAQKVLVLCAGWIFYGWWDIRFVPLLWAYTLIGWGAGMLLDRRMPPRLSRIVFPVSIALVLGMLAYFKYTNFMLATFGELFGFGAPSFSIILPVGISFITFEVISYIVDVHTRKLEPCYDLLDFALFNGFFPRLISGPIIRPADFLPQLRQAPRLDVFRLFVGGQIFLLGMFQKVVLADNLAPFVDHVYRDPLLFSSGTVWLAVLAYSGQIYGDFAGYSLMAIGLARMLGFTLPRNFNHPYLSLSITEFWQRWHISLSSWLRDYLYVPLGGNRKGNVRTYVNLMITMLLGGLWHGAGWNFVLWGALHGAALGIHRAYRKVRGSHVADSNTAWPSLFKWALTFAFVSLAWIPFRSPNEQITVEFFRGLFAGGAISWYPPQVLLAFAVLVGMELLSLPAFRRLRPLPSTDPLQPAPVFLLVAIGWCIILFQPSNASPFIYFQF